MKNYVFILLLFCSFSLYAKEYDWTPVFKGWEVGCNTGNIDGLNYNSKLDYIKYVEKPITKKQVEYYGGGESVYIENTFKVKQGVYYSMPVSEIRIDGYEASELASVSFIINLPFKSVKKILKSKNVIYKKVYAEHLDGMNKAVIAPDKKDKQKTQVLCRF